MCAVQAGACIPTEVNVCVKAGICTLMYGTKIPAAFIFALVCFVERVGC